MNIQAPPNLSPGVYPRLIAAGINDWGGVSPVTPDHVNPEAPWPAITELAERTAAAGKLLVHRLPIYPSYMRDLGAWTRAGDRHAGAPSERRRRLGARRQLGAGHEGRPAHAARSTRARSIQRSSASSSAPERARAWTNRRSCGCSRRATPTTGASSPRPTSCAATVSGDTVRYVVNRNINYTNICSYRCTFCAFSKGKTHEALRGAPYDLALEEIVRRADEAWERGATEVCLQGGIHPDYTGATYLGICRAIKAAVPEMHIHAFSPLEVTQGAATLGAADRGHSWRS